MLGSIDDVVRAVDPALALRALKSPLVFDRQNTLTESEAISEILQEPRFRRWFVAL